MNPVKILAQKLKKGDYVSFVSPSAGLAPFAMHRIDQAKKVLEEMGLNIKVEKNALKNTGYVSSTIDERIEDLHSAFSDEKVKIIICSIGGNHSNQLLKYINWEIIKSNPKIFIGYSDITVLHHAIFKKTGLITFYGPCIMPEFGEKKQNEFTLNYFNKALFDGSIGKIDASTSWTDEFLDWFEKEDLVKDRIYVKNSGYEWWRGGIAEGDFFGGCIPSINHLAGTEYWNDLDQKIFFIDLPEGTDPGIQLDFSDLDAYLADLDNIGVFKDLKGLVIGRPYGYKNYNKDKVILKEIIMKYVEHYNYPVMFGADIGHTAPMITIPFNCKVILNSGENLFELNGEFIK